MTAGCSRGLGKVSFWHVCGFHVTFLIQHSWASTDAARVSSTRAGWDLMTISTVGLIPARQAPADDHQRCALGQEGAIAARPVEGEHAGVVHAVPAAENNFDVIPRVRLVEPMKDIARRSSARRGEAAHESGKRSWAVIATRQPAE
jgi:cytochrome c oxidase subunit 1